jgi:hypothetical protein
MPTGSCTFPLVNPHGTTNAGKPARFTLTCMKESDLHSKENSFPEELTT